MKKEKFLKILIIDDKKEEREKAKIVIEKAGYYYYEAEDLHEALMLLGDQEGADTIMNISANFPKHPYSKINWDGVITDLHFPLITGGICKEEALGLEIAILCQQKKIPCVICTDLNHHRTNWIDRIARRLGIEVVPDKGLSTLAWQEALNLLLKEE